EPRPVLVREPPGAQALELDTAFRAHQPLGDLELRHLEREDRDRDAVLEREVGGDPEGERRLAPARPARADHEVARLEARRQVVDVAEPGRRPGQLAAPLVHARDLLEALADERLDVLEAAADAVLRELED